MRFQPVRSMPGYILLECLMALSILSIGTIVIHRDLRETIAVRGQAQDYTHARFLLEQLVAKLELQPMLMEKSASGRFEGSLSRFSWKWKVSKVELPMPPIPPEIPPEEAARLKLNAPHLTRIEATVSWKRSGRRFEETVETLWDPEKLYVPKELGP